jgi:hypothetical protein
METRRVFVSYAREDRATVDRLSADLRALGQDVWYDEHLLGGTDWWAEILRRIQGADVFLFALSPSSVGSAACLAELAWADATRRRLLPVMVEWTEPVALPAVLAHAQYVDYRGVGWQSLAEALRAMPIPPPLPDPLPTPPVLPEPPLARLRRRALDPQMLTPGAQHELIDDILRESRRPGQWGPSYDALLAVGARADLFAEVGRRLQPELEELWRRGPHDQQACRLSPWAHIPKWSLAYLVGATVAGFFTVGISTGYLWWKNRAIPTRRQQVRLLVAVQVSLWVVIFVLSAIFGDSTTTTSP